MPSLDEQRLRSLAQKTDAGLLVSEFHVPEMHCSGCMSKIEKGLSALPFVKAARSNLSTKRVNVTWDGAAGDALDLQTTLDELGFEATAFQLADLEESDGVLNHLLMCLGVAGFAAANIMLLSVSVWSGADGATRQLFHLISGMIAIPAIAYAGRPFFSSAGRALRAGHLNMDVPISLAVIIATALSIYESLTDGENAYFDAATMLLFFLLIGRTLDHVMRERARSAVTALAGLAAKGGIVIGADGARTFVTLRDIQAGDRLLVPAGERIPVDSIVVQGESEIDRSLVTGESRPQNATIGVPLEAGAVNISSLIEVRATKAEGDSFLAEVLRLMEAAERGKAGFVRIADRAARIYAPAVHLLALATFLGWMFASGGDWHAAVYTAVAVLIITCPCALGLAVPIVHVIAAGRLFEKGVMLKDGTALEKLREINTIVFDKTGTLTMGVPKVTGTSATPRHRALAAGIASASAHPMAKSISAYLSAEPHFDANLQEIRDVPGCGIEARIEDQQQDDGRIIRLGKRSWVNEIAAMQRSGETPPDARHSTVWIGEQDQPAAHFALQDTLRPETAPVVHLLQNEGLQIEILSGDTAGPVQDVATELAIAQAASEQSPQDKIKRIDALREAGRKVLMVGDGLNDAPALAAAHVSMAPSSGSDVGRQSADLVFTHASLDCIPFARSIALRADSLVKQNIGIAILYNCIAVPFAIAGFVNPLVAALAMSASSILVVANSMRLQWGSSTAVPSQVDPRAERGYNLDPAGTLASAPASTLRPGPMLNAPSPVEAAR